MLESILVVWVPDTINEAVKVCLDSPKLSSSDWVHYNDAAGGWDRWGVNAKLKLCNRKRPQLTPFPSQLKGMRNMNAAAFRTSRSPSAAAKAYSIYSIRCSIYILRWAACDVQELLFRSTYGFAPLDENTQRSPSLAFDLLAKVHIKAMGVNSGDIMKY